MSDLDTRAMAMADRIERSGDTEAAEALRASLAYLREALSGSDQAGNLVEDLRTVAESAATATEIVAHHLDVPKD